MKAVEIKAYALSATIGEQVYWCSQHTNYIRYCYSDATRSKVLDEDEIRNKLTRVKLLKRTQNKPQKFNILFSFIDTQTFTTELNKLKEKYNAEKKHQ